MTRSQQTNIKSVLLVWDIGEGKDGRYHIGDERMFYYNYQHLAATWRFEIYATSRSICHSYIPTWKEVRRIYFRDWVVGILQLLFYSIFFRLFPSRTVPWKILHIINIVDYVIISWWGNINSIRSGHLYFRFRIGFMCRVYWKKLYLSWQTIWPLSTVDRWLSTKLISWCECILLRDTTYSVSHISYQHPWVRFWVDDAFLPFEKDIKEALEKKCTFADSGEIRIWLSLHEPYKAKHSPHSPHLITLLGASLHTANFSIIPHVFDNKNGYDISFMIQQLPLGISATILDYDTMSTLENSTKARKESIIEFYTSKMDYVLTTRYHWAVFAIKHGTIPIMISRNEYEYQKFRWLLDSLHLSHLAEILIFSEWWETSGEEQPWHHVQQRIQQNIPLVVSMHQEIQNSLYTAVKNIPPQHLFINTFLTAHD